MAAPQIQSLAPAGSCYHSKTLLNCILSTRSYHSADCDTDHCLVGSKVRLQPKRVHRSTQKGRPRITTARTAIRDLCEGSADFTEEALGDCHTTSAEERWNHIRVTTYKSAMDTFGNRERQNADWFEAGIAELEPAIAAKRAALLETLWLDTLCTQEGQERCPTDRSTPRQR